MCVCVCVCQGTEKTKWAGNRSRVCVSVCSSVKSLGDHLQLQEKQELGLSCSCIDQGLLRTCAVGRHRDPHPSPSPFNFTFHPHPRLTCSVFVYLQPLSSALLRGARDGIGPFSDFRVRVCTCVVICWLEIKLTFLVCSVRVFVCRFWKSGALWSEVSASQPVCALPWPLAINHLQICVYPQFSSPAHRHLEGQLEEEPPPQRRGLPPLPVTRRHTNTHIHGVILWEASPESQP